MIGCDMLSREIGGKEKVKEHLQTIAQAIMSDPRLGNLCQNGWHCTKATVVNEGSLAVKQLNLRLQNTDGEIAAMNLELTLALRLSSAHISSVTLRKLSQETKRLRKVYSAKCDLQLSWEHSNQPLPSFPTYVKSGKRTPRTSDFSVSVSPESWTAPFSTM